METDLPSASAPAIAGIWLPLVTPFRNGALDEASLARLAAHYAAPVCRISASAGGC